MNVNGNFSERTVVHSARMPWVPSPMPGVERRMLDRIGGEVARATTIVRYAPDSRFSAHVHGGGEEFLVLDGVFQDEHGDYSEGTYIRNPPGTSHTPRSRPGCTMLVKLWQFDPADRAPVTVDTNSVTPITAPGRAGVKAITLFRDHRECVRLEVWSAGQSIELDPKGGLEVLVLSGEFTEAGETFTRHSWLRLPVGAPLRAKSGPEGCRVWVKEGHLDHVEINLPQA